jgi:hypothetical protein
MMDRYPGKRDTQLRAWIAKVSPTLGPVSRRHLKLQSVRAFAKNVFDVLNAKAAGESVADRVRELCQPLSFDISERGQFLEIIEDDDEWWAAEYLGVFSELGAPSADASESWLSMTGTCAHCGGFFVKQRTEQRFCTPGHRQRYNNALSAQAVKSTQRVRRPSKRGSK